MIVKILPRRGGTTRASARKLMAYLLGPGEAPTGEELEPGQLGNRHTEPRVVTGWDPTRTACWAEHCRAIDWAAADAAWRTLHTLAQGIGDETAAGARLEDTAQPRSAVWHTIMAAHPQDGQLTDEAWRVIAWRLMHQTGLHPDGSDNPVRWVAVRHGPNAAGADHIHVMAVLVRLDGTRASTHNDVFAAQAAARWAEQEFGLTPGRGRTSPDAPGEGLRADRPASRSDMAAATKGGPPYPRPPGMNPAMWDRVQREGRDRMWTRQGRARAAVLSAAARAISGEHLVALVAEQGYQVRLRYSQTNPRQVTGWSVVAPPGARARRPKAFAGRALGADCTWPALIAHIQARGAAMGLGIVSGQDGSVMIDRARMIAAGWGADFIDKVIAADHALIDATPGADPALAYWMRDVFWQVAWAVEGSHGKHGVWSDAAYLYSAIAVGGVPAPPTQVRAALADLASQLDAARTTLDLIAAQGAERDRTARDLLARGAAADRIAGKLSARPHIPKYLTSPGGTQYAGAAALAIALATADIHEHRAALRNATKVHAENAARLTQLRDEDRRAAHYVEHQLGPWVAAAKQHQARLEAALGAHDHANNQWRQAAGRLLAEVRSAGDLEAAGRVVGLDARYRPPAHHPALQ